MESDDPFSHDGFRFGYPIKHFDEAVTTRDDAKLVALFNEWFADNERSQTPLEYFHRAVEFRMHSAIRELATSPRLLHSGYGNILPVQLAVFAEDLETLDVLIDAGGDIDGTVDDGPTAAFIPVVTDNANLLKALKHRGADLGSTYVLPDGTSRSLIDLATLLQRTEILQILQQFQVDAPSNQPKEKPACKAYVLIAWGRTFCERELLPEVISWFKAHPILLKEDPGILIEAAEEGRSELIQAYIDAGANIDAFEFPTGTALSAAAAKNKIGSAQLLIQLGADLEATDDSPMPTTALFKAVSNGHVEMARLLMKHNADPNAMFLTWSCTPRNCLEFLKSRDREETELYKLLVDHGAKLPTLVDMVEKYPEQAMSISEKVVSAENYAEAIELISHLIQKEPDSVLHYQRGVAYDMTEKLTDALADFDAAIELDSQNFQAIYSRALVQRKLGRWEESLADLETAFVVNPSDYRTANALAIALLSVPNESMCDSRRAVELAAEACRLSEWDDVVCIDTLEAAYRAIGDQEKANTMAHKASVLREREAST